MISLTVEHNLQQLNRVLAEYTAVSGKTSREVLLKQGNKLGYELLTRLRTLAPPKGRTLAERLQGLSAGKGVHVRPSVLADVKRTMQGATVDDQGRLRKMGTRGRVELVRSFLDKNRRPLNSRAVAVKRELGLRERGRGYLSLAGSLRPPGMTGGLSDRLRGRYNQMLGEVDWTVGTDDTGLVFRYGGEGNSLGEAMSTPKARAQIAASMAAVKRDMLVYLARKHREAFQRCLKAA